MTTPHPTTRLVITHQPASTLAHISPGCAHGVTGGPLCGAPTETALACYPQDTPHLPWEQWGACRDCVAVAAADHFGFVPAGPEPLIQALGYPPAQKAFAQLREQLRELPSLAGAATASVGTMHAARDTHGLAHLDKWCPGYDAYAKELLEVSLGAGGAPDFGERVHCRRGLPTHIEDALAAAAHIVDDRQHLIMLGTRTPAHLYVSVRAIRTNDTLATADGVVTRLAGPPPSTWAVDGSLREEAGINRAAWAWTDAIDDDWPTSAEARSEAAKMLALLVLRDDEQHTGFENIRCFHLEHSTGPVPFTMMFVPAHSRIDNTGRVMSLAEAAPHLDGMIPGLAAQVAEAAVLPKWVADDVHDCARTQEKAVQRYAGLITAHCLGRIVVVTDSNYLPMLWEAWPHKALEGGGPRRMACWVPDLMIGNALDTDFFDPATEPITQTVACERIQAVGFPAVA